MAASDDSERELLADSIIQQSDEQIQQLRSDHAELLTYSIKIGALWILISVSQRFFFCCRWYIWILYARSLGEHSVAMLAFATYSVYFIQAFANVFWGWIADKYTYDRIGTVLSFFVLIGLIMESCALRYSVLLAGTIIVDVFRAHSTLSVSFLAQYLPTFYAIKYQSYRFSLLGAANLLGPVIGGIMTDLIDIKAPFYFSAVIALFSFLTFIFVINGTQNKVHSQQAKLKILYDALKHSNNNESSVDDIGIDGDNLQDVDYQFPISTTQYIEDQKKEHTLFPSLTAYQWFMLVNVLTANASALANEAAVATYFVVLAGDLYNLSVIASTAMAIAACFCYILACVLTPPFMKKYSTSNFKTEFCVILIWGMLMILFCYFSKHFLDTLGFYFLWIYCGVTGLAIGISTMSSEIVILTIQPKQHAGKIGGVKKFFRSLCAAFITLLIGSLWDIDIYWFFYGQSIFWLIVVVCTAGMMIGTALH